MTNDDPFRLARIEQKIEELARKLAGDWQQRQEIRDLTEPNANTSMAELSQKIATLYREAVQRWEARIAARQSTPEPIDRADRSRYPAMTNYSADFYAWTQEQAKFIRAGQFHQLDLENLAEEIESLGRQERRELRNRLAVLVGHLLKWQFQPAGQSASWRVTIRAQRREIQRLLKENPSLKPYLGEAVTDSYDDALALALRETGLEQFPDECPYSVKQVIDVSFLPG